MNSNILYRHVASGNQYIYSKALLRPLGISVSSLHFWICLDNRSSILWASWAACLETLCFKKPLDTFDLCWFMRVRNFSRVLPTYCKPQLHLNTYNKIGFTVYHSFYLKAFSSGGDNYIHFFIRNIDATFASFFSTFVIYTFFLPVSECLVLFRWCIFFSKVTWGQNIFQRFSPPK